ncbi:MAG: metal-dependent hydrolase [Candidatus Hodarchaeota archaeon]
MDFFTHIVVSVALTNQLSQDEDSQRAFIIGGIAPDLDVLVFWIPVVIPQLYILQHRGLLHTVILAPFVVIALIFSTRYFKRFNCINRLEEPFQEMITEFNPTTVILGVLGFLLHLGMDCITQGGLHLFFPLINQRIAISTISIIDPLITLFSSVVVLRFIYSILSNSTTYSVSQFKKSAKYISILFVILLSFYGLLQFNTIITHSPTATTPGIIPPFRWFVNEKNNGISIHLVNQLNQKIVKTYNYSPLTYNKTRWNNIIIESVVEQVKGKLKFKEFEFQLGAETRLAFNVTFHEMENRWEIVVLDTLRDAQNRFYGIASGGFLNNEVVIHLSQE